MLEILVYCPAIVYWPGYHMYMPYRFNGKYLIVLLPKHVINNSYVD